MLQLEEEEAPEVPFDEWLLDYAARYLFQFSSSGWLVVMKWILKNSSQHDLLHGTQK